MAASGRRTGRKKTGARKVKTYDLHNHVVPESVIQAVKRDPKRYGRRVVEKKGKRYFDAHGRLIELRPEFCDVEAKIDAIHLNMSSPTPKIIAVVPMA